MNVFHRVPGRPLYDKRPVALLRYQRLDCAGTVACVVAIAASLFVALTVTPAMSYMLLTGRAHSAERDPPLTRVLKRGYLPVLPAFVARPWQCLAARVLAFAVTGAAATRLGQEFLPNFQETDFLMHFVEKPGTSVKAMNRVTTAASKEPRALEDEKGQKLVRNFGSHIGRAEVADEPVGPNFTELWISTPEDADYEQTVKKIADVVYTYPGLHHDLLTYLRERIKEVLTGASGSVVVRLYGPDTAVLREGEGRGGRDEGRAGVTNLKVEPRVLVAQINVQLRPEDLRKFGLTPGHVRRASTVLLKGQKVDEVFDGQKKFDVVVWGASNLRSGLGAVQELPIDVQNGTQVRLKDVADVRIVSAPNEVRRENTSRRLDVTCNVSGRDLGSVAREVEEKVKQIPFEREYHPEFLGEYQARQESTRKLYARSALALAGIVLLLFVDFGAWRPTLLVALTIPFALVGGVFAVTIALATGLALLPLAITGNKPGQEIEYPLAVVILDGLVTSTLLNLSLLPPLYFLVGRPVSAIDCQ
ncbi:efflux RND transporter permease subunit [Gemmata sp. SH-PL17]|uniref:efflux RND transporter permease subunit n=1 Tax=Gemmata sp. SH-PL17 TaxID=1630693 RepID=UPI00194DFC2D|nr:efflux RND transporter permease subunit [Gemmata sp. SH-PL17]